MAARVIRVSRPKRSAQNAEPKKAPGLYWRRNPPLTLDDGLKIYERFRLYVQHEDNLINNRLSWMLTVHGFLYASYGLVLSKQQDTLNALATPTFSDPQAKPAGVFIAAIGIQYDALHWFLISIILVGFLISLSGLLSTGAATVSVRRVVRLFRRQNVLSNFNPLLPGQRDFLSRILRRQITDYTPFTPEDGHWTKIKAYDTDTGVRFPRLSGGGSRWAAICGSLGVIGIPIILMSGWVLAFVVLREHEASIERIFYYQSFFK